MSSVLPSGWNVDANDGNGAPLSSAGGSAGAWVLAITVNAQTSITCVDLPYFSKEHPLSGTKPARVMPAPLL